MAQEAGLTERSCLCHGAEEQQLQDRQVGYVLHPGWIQLYQVRVSARVLLSWSFLKQGAI